MLVVAVLVEPGHGLPPDVVDPYPHVTGFQRQCQSGVLPADVACGASGSYGVEQVDAQYACEEEYQEVGHHPYPRGDAGVLPLRIEPFVLQLLQPVLRAQHGIGAVHQRQQLRVVGHEPVFAVGHVYGLYLQVVGMELVELPFQRHRVPYDDALALGAHLQHGLFHVVIGDGVLFPALFLHQVVTVTAFVHDDAVSCQVVERLDGLLFTFWIDHAVGGQVQRDAAVLAVFVMVGCLQAYHHVGLAAFQVIQYFAEVFELDFIGHAQLLENHPHQVHTVAGGLAVFQEGVGPYVPGVFIDHRVVSSEVEGIFCLVLRITLRQSTQQNNQQGDKTLLPYATVAPPLGILQWIDHLRLF